MKMLSEAIFLGHFFPIHLFWSWTVVFRLKTNLEAAG